MSSSEVKRAISRLLTDDDFAQRFQDDALEALLPFDLTLEESEALKTLDLSQVSDSDIRVSRDMDLSAIKIASVYLS